MVTNSISRRRFLATSGAAAVVSAVPARRVRAKGSANEKLVFGVIGIGGQGGHLTRNTLMIGKEKIALAAVADVDPHRWEATSREMKQKSLPEPVYYQDFRKLLDHKDIDYVVIATPDHWHAIAMISACQAGKDVYVEKPCSHTIAEGRAMVNAARKYKRIVQVGQQQRSDLHFREAMAYLRDKKPLGTISRTATYNFGNDTPDGIGNPPDCDPPPGVDYDRWLGPAPKRPFNPNRFHDLYRWFFDYSGGMLTDWNVHVHDIVHWGMDVDAPRWVAASGGKRVLTDNRDTPDLLDVIWEYSSPRGDFTQIYTMSKCYEKGKYPVPYGTEFFGSEGSLFINRGGWSVTPQMRNKQIDDPDHPGKKKTVREPGTAEVRKKGNDHVGPHIKNFWNCIRSRKWEDLNCDIEVGHRTATACQLGNIALRLGKKIYWDGKKEIITDKDGTPDGQANALLTKEYRKGYELPAV